MALLFRDESNEALLNKDIFRFANLKVNWSIAMEKIRITFLIQGILPPQEYAKDLYYLDAKGRSVSMFMIFFLYNFLVNAGITC